MPSARLVRGLPLAAVVAWLAMAAPAGATYPGANGILSWSGQAILGVDPGSTTERVIVDVPGGADEAPSWTADGQQLAFEHDDDPNPGFQGSIWKANADGTGATQITNGPKDRHPSWSPDGQRLVFASATGDRDIFVVDADGSNLTQLTFTPGNEKDPSWSPDGTKIAYERSAGSGEEIWTMNPDGTGQTFLAPGLAPDWSPFGDELVISGRYPNTGELRRISADGTQTYPLGEIGDDPVFSPDGTQIAYTKSFCCQGFRYDIVTIGYAGGAPLSPTDPGYRIFAGWQPVPAASVPGYVRPKGATPLRVPLVPAYRQCESPDREHGPPLAFGACSSPQQTSTTTTIGTPDANGAAANSTGSVRFDAVLGDPTTAADEADIAVVADITDVRLRVNDADYPTALDLVWFVSITERETPLSPVTTTGPDPNTAAFYSWPLRVNVPCTTNSDPSIGSQCQVATTLDAVVPGAVPERHRAIWALDKVRVYDAGGDGYVSTTDDNELFAVQGILVP